MAHKHPTKPQTASLPLKTSLLLLVSATATNASLLPGGRIDRRPRNLIDFKSAPNSNPLHGVKTLDVTIDLDSNLWFRVFIPANTTGKLPVFIYFHGGGFTFYSPDSKPFDGLCRRFCRSIPAVVVSVNYRLAPEHRYPIQYDDGFEVFRFMDEDRNRKHLPENADITHCFVAGDSAGGNIAHHVCKRASVYRFHKLKVIGLVALQPFFGGEERTASELSPLNSKGLSLKHTDWFWNALNPLSKSSMEEWNRDNEVINVSGPRAADISKQDFPATLVVVGGRDILQDWQRKYYEWLKMSGKEAYMEEYPCMFHGFYVFQELPEASHLVLVVTDFVNKMMNKYL